MSTIFNEDQRRLIVKFFADLGTKIGTYNKNGKEIYQTIDQNSKWFPDLEDMLPTVNAVLSESPKKIKHLDPLVSYYNSIPYSANKSKGVIIKCLDALSEKFKNDNIPLLYITSLIPSEKNYPSSIWSELVSMKSFAEEDYGHIAFIETIQQLLKDGIIHINSFSILLLNPSSIVLKVTLQYKNPTVAKKIDLFRGDLLEEGSSGAFSHYNDGAVRYYGELLEMRRQLNAMARLFISNPNSIISIDDIKDAISTGDDWANLEKPTIAKYVSELRKVFKKKSGKNNIFNQQNIGWTFKP